MVGGDMTKSSNGVLTMIDEIAVQQTINRYSDGASRRDWERVLSTFTSDATWEIPTFGVVFREHGVIRDAMAGFVAQMAYWVQVNAPALITVNGDRANARSTIRECGKFADRDEALEVLGYYEDELKRTEQGWKFTRRVFHALGQHRFALLKTEPLQPPA
jgi:ketosteroid isomerase-like protein